MHNITAIAPAIAANQLAHRDRDGFIIMGAPRHHTTYIFLYNRRRRKGADRQPQNGINIATKEERHTGNHRSSHQGPRKLPTEGSRAGMAPAHQWPDPHEQNQEQEKRPIDFVKERRRHRNAITRQQLTEHREEGAPKRCKGDPGEQPVISQKGRFTAGIRIKLMIIAQQRQAVKEQPQEAGNNDNQEAEEKGAYITTRKTVDTFQHTATGGKGAQDHQKIGEPNQHHIPNFEDAALFLNNQAMQEGGSC